jgi:hypothetical protein
MHWQSATYQINNTRTSLLEDAKEFHIEISQIPPWQGMLKIKAWICDLLM